MNAISPVETDLARWYRGMDESAAQEAWEESIKREAAYQYIDEGDLWDAIGRIDDAEKLINRLWLARQVRDLKWMCQIIDRIMELGAQDSAESVLDTRKKMMRIYRDAVFGIEP